MTNPMVSDPDEARDVLDEVARLRRETRRAGQALWFPLILFGLITLAAAPFYARTFQLPDMTGVGSGQAVTVTSRGPGDFGVLGGFTAGWRQIALFWLIAAPAGYIVTAAFYFVRSRRLGLRISWLPYLLASLATLALIALLTTGAVPGVSGWFLDEISGDLVLRGMLPLLAIGVGFLVLAAVQRSRAFAAFAVGWLGLALVANLYDMQNLVHSTSTAVNPIIVGAVLLLAGAAFAARRHLGRYRLRITKVTAP